jgi:hypothetical protein
MAYLKSFLMKNPFLLFFCIPFFLVACGEETSATQAKPLSPTITNTATVTPTANVYNSSSNRVNLNSSANKPTVPNNVRQQLNLIAGGNGLELCNNQKRIEMKSLGAPYFNVGDEVIMAISGFKADSDITVQFVYDNKVFTQTQKSKPCGVTNPFPDDISVLLGTGNQTQTPSNEAITDTTPGTTSEFAFVLARPGKMELIITGGNGVTVKHIVNVGRDPFIMVLHNTATYDVNNRQFVINFDNLIPNYNNPVFLYKHPITTTQNIAVYDTYWYLQTNTSTKFTLDLTLPKTDSEPNMCYYLFLPLSGSVARLNCNNKLFYETSSQSVIQSPSIQISATTSITLDNFLSQEDVYISIRYNYPDNCHESSDNVEQNKTVSDNNGVITATVSERSSIYCKPAPPPYPPSVMAESITVWAYGVQSRKFNSFTYVIR